MKSMYVLLWCCELKAKVLNLRISVLNTQINIIMHSLSISLIVLLTACSRLEKEGICLWCGIVRSVNVNSVLRGVNKRSLFVFF